MLVVGVGIHEFRVNLMNYNLDLRSFRSLWVLFICFTCRKVHCPFHKDLLSFNSVRRKVKEELDLFPYLLNLSCRVSCSVSSQHHTYLWALSVNPSTHREISPDLGRRIKNPLISKWYFVNTLVCFNYCYRQVGKHLD